MTDIDSPRQATVALADISAYVVNLPRRRDRLQRMQRTLPPGLDVTFTSDWDGPFDGQTLDPFDLERAGVELFPWRTESGNPWWSRPLKAGEIGCALAHWTCWQHSHAHGDRPYILILEDDAMLCDAFADRLTTALQALHHVHAFDLLYLGRVPLEPDQPLIDGFVRPGYSHCTFGYILARSALTTLLGTRLDQAIIPIDEFLPAMYVDHPRLDVRRRFPARLRALAAEPPLVSQQPKAVAGSDTEDSPFADW